MTPDAFIAAVTALEGLPPAMKERLVELAPQMSEKDREGMLMKFSEADKDINDTLTEEAKIYKDAADQLHKADRAMTKDEENQEKNTAQKNSDDMLSNM